MSKVVIIADDLTGANATGVLLARQGFKVATFLDLKKYNPEENTDLDVVCISTDSRAIEENEAYKRVSDVVKYFKNENVALFTNRIDSTLRGNLGAETAAILDGLSKDTIAVVVPSFPSSGRVCIGGYLMVNQVPLERTDVAKDPKNPIKTSSVVTQIQKQIKEKVGFIELSRVLKGFDSIESALINEIENGCRVIVVDATTDEDIAHIAKAAKRIKFNVIPVDPGPFTAALTKEFLGMPKETPGQKVMVTVGSVSNLTRKQMEELKVKHDPLLIYVNALNLIYEDKSETQIDQAVEILLKKMEKYKIIGVTTTGSESEVIDMKKLAAELATTEDELSQRIADGLARITSKVLEGSGSQIGGLFTSGGDVTVAVCKELQSAGIEVKDEVLPLAVYGRITKGNFDNTPIITKGGLIGDEKAIIKCVEYLLTKLSNEFHSNK